MVTYQQKAKNITFVLILAGATMDKAPVEKFILKF
jgi:hypothetical protein